MVDDNVSRMGCDQLVLYSFVWNLPGYDLISLLTDLISVILEFSALTFALIVFRVPYLEFWQAKKPAVYDLIDIPDDQLTPDQMSIKKRQRMLKNAREGRLRAQAVQRERQQKVGNIFYNLKSIFLRWQSLMEENLTLIYINEFDPILTLTLLLERYSQC